MPTTQIAFRADEKIKREATEVAQAMGLELSDTLRMFVHKMAKDKTLPFTFTDRNNESALSKHIKLMNEFAQSGFDSEIKLAPRRRYDFV
ncbi:MAG: type II toxin-antitoxin system RelB/DinJ family antitoxin [Bifidobacteriaceae bacterium]|jgi:addiction module RelB/DinJ family antitoxin|nr:type II toxin-antitoxin system RelB/DinJ family antitoxin [Bifidobacteriaceae bacterium]